MVRSFKRPDLWFGVLTYIGVMNAFCLVLTGINADKSIHTYQSGLWFAGFTPYKDYTEVNIPMNAIILQISHFIGSIFHFSLQQVADLHILLFILLCIFIIRMATTILQTGLNEKNPFSKTDLWIFGLLAFGFSHDTVWFGDRESMIAILTFLYLLRFSPLLLEAELPNHQRLVVGVLAAVGFCLKPHTVPIWLSINLYSCIRHRTFRYLFMLENIVIYVFTACFLTYFYFGFPEYFKTVLPVALEFYKNYSNENRYLEYVIGFAISCLLPIAVSLIDRRKAQKSPYLETLPYLFCALFGCVVFSLINNVWMYTLVPSRMVAFCIVGLMFKHFQFVLQHSEQFARQARQAMVGMSAVMAVYVLNTLYTNMVLCSQSLRYGYPTNERAIQIFRQLTDELRTNHAQSFASFSVPYLIWVDLAIYSGKRWGLSINHFWMSPNDAQRERVLSGHDADWRYHFIVDQTTRDLISKRPDVLFVPHACTDSALCTYFDVFGILKSSPEFWQIFSAQYRFSHLLDLCGNGEDSAGQYCKYDVFVRIRGRGNF